MDLKDFLANFKPREYEAYRPAYHRHHQIYNATRGLSFDKYEPAYRFGYDMAFDVNYQNRYWAELEPEVRARWEAEGDGVWDDVAGAIRHAWEEVKGIVDSDNEERYGVVEPSFRRHYDLHHASEGKSYADYEPAYRLSYELARDPRFLYHDWFEIEAAAKERWEEIGNQPWEAVADTIRPAIEAVRRNSRLLAYNEFDTTFRRHYQTHYATVGGHAYDWYKPAYRFGYDLAMDRRYAGSNWYGVETEAQRRWEERGAQAWDEVKDAVRRAWHEVKSAMGANDPYDITFSSLRRQYDDRFSAMGYPQNENYEPGYRFGYFLAADTRYRDKAWRDVINTVEEYWHDNPIGSLENFRLAAKDAWDEVKSLLKQA